MTVAVASAVWLWGWGRHLSAARMRGSRDGDGAMTFEPTNGPVLAAAFNGWKAPLAQLRGSEWTYELFAPPEINIDPATGEFSVAQSQGAVASEDEADSAEDELGLADRRPFCLQLLGMVGTGTHLLGSFENTRTGEVFLVGRGAQVPGLDLVVTDLRAKRVRAGASDESALSQWIATALVCDRHDVTTELRAGETAYMDGSTDADE